MSEARGQLGKGENIKIGIGLLKVWERKLLKQLLGWY